jgi:hypothetical protein
LVAKFKEKTAAERDKRAAVNTSCSQSQTLFHHSWLTCPLHAAHSCGTAGQRSSIVWPPEGPYFRVAVKLATQCSPFPPAPCLLSQPNSVAPVALPSPGTIVPSQTMVSAPCVPPQPHSNLSFTQSKGGFLKEMTAWSSAGNPLAVSHSLRTNSTSFPAHEVPEPGPWPLVPAPCIPQPGSPLHVTCSSKPHHPCGFRPGKHCSVAHSPGFLLVRRTFYWVAQAPV